MEKLELSKLDDVAQKLERYIQSARLNFLFGSGASLPAIQLAGAIEQEIDKYIADSQHVEANKKALDFIEKLESQNQLLHKNYKNGGKIDITLQNYICFLRSIDRILFERKSTLLSRQANIFTTNYDEFFEVAASKSSTVVLNDGFNRQVGETAFEFTPETFSDRVYRSGIVYQYQTEVPTINLIKLHGSVSWKHDKNGGILFGRPKKRQLIEIDNNNIEDVKSELAKRAIILPNMRKFESTVLDRIYFDLLRLYSNALEAENSLLFVFGFSFADQHTLDITKRSLRNPTAMVVLFAHSLATVVNFEKKFSKYRNVLVIYREAKKINFKALISLFEYIGGSSDTSDE